MAVVMDADRVSRLTCIAPQRDSSNATAASTIWPSWAIAGGVPLAARLAAALKDSTGTDVPTGP